jgi:hypothetical protein
MVISLLQHRREKRSAKYQETASAYGDLLVGSLNFAFRAMFLRVVVEHRSGAMEGPSVFLGLKPPLDAPQLLESLLNDMKPLNQAWSRIWVVGTQEAINAADSLVSACGDLLETATSWNLTLFGIKKWSNEEQSAYDETMLRMARDRAAFVGLMRKELGKEKIELALERAERERLPRADPAQS